MPYEIVKRGGKWCVTKEGGSKTFGCHPSKGKAEAQLRALYASESKGLSVFKGSDGARYMLVITSNSYKDREGEYISTEALTNYVESQWTGEAFKGTNPLLFWHDNPAIGWCSWADMEGPFLVEIFKERLDGSEDIRTYTKAIWDYLEAPPEPYGASHGYGYASASRVVDADGATYRRIYKFETSALPLWGAANALTYSGVVPMTTARDQELEKIQPGLGQKIRRALGLVKDELDESGVQHKQLGPVATRADLIDLVVLVTKNTMAQAVEIGQKAEGADAPAIDLHQIAGEALDALLDVPAVALDTAESILAVDEADGADAPAETETHDHPEGENAQESDKALTALADLTRAVITDQGAVISEIKALTDAVKGVADLPARVGEMEKAIKAIQAQFEQRPRASQASETEAGQGIQKAMETLAATEKSKTSGIWPA